MISHFKEKYDKFEYEFIEDNNFPEKEIVTCVFAMLHYKGKIYLTKNRRGWELPGGHIESGENFDVALDREISEEAGTRIKNKELFGYKKYHNFSKIENRDGGFYPSPYGYIIYYTGEATGENLKKDCPDTIDWGLFSIEEALEKVDSDVNKKIIEIMKNK